jgi:hypothetical protein
MAFNQKILRWRIPVVDKLKRGFNEDVKGL